LVVPVIGFGLCALAILWAGTRLTSYTDVIALRTRLGRIWAGMLLLAVATSLPELINCTSAAIRGLPDIAAGDIAGSNVINLAILGGSDLFSPGRTCFLGLHRYHLRSVWVIVLMSGLAGAAMLLGDRVPVLGWVSPFGVVLLVIYFLRVSRSHPPDEEATLAPTIPTISLRTAVVRYLLLASMIVVAALLLPGFAARIASGTGLGNTFVGTFLVAVATSLPEAVTAVAAVRMGAPELAAGGILGSNLFNLAIFGVADLFYWRGSLLASVEPTQLVPLATGLVLVVLFGLVIRHCPRRRLLRLTWFGWTALAAWLLSGVLLYRLR
jgi:cation:H+ antiporter